MTYFLVDPNRVFFLTPNNKYTAASILLHVTSCNLTGKRYETEEEFKGGGTKERMKESEPRDESYCDD